MRESYISGELSQDGGWFRLCLDNVKMTGGKLENIDGYVRVKISTTD